MRSDIEKLLFTTVMQVLEALGVDDLDDADKDNINAIIKSKGDKYEKTNK